MGSEQLRDAYHCKEGVGPGFGGRGSIILVGRIWGSMTHLGRWGTPGGTEWRVIGKIMKER